MSFLSLVIFTLTRIAHIYRKFDQSEISYPFIPLDHCCRIWLYVSYTLIPENTLLLSCFDKREKIFIERRVMERHLLGGQGRLIKAGESQGRAPGQALSALKSWLQLILAKYDINGNYSIY